MRKYDGRSRSARRKRQRLTGIKQYVRAKKRGLLPAKTTFQNHFGSWSNALRKADISLPFMFAKGEAA